MPILVQNSAGCMLVVNKVTKKTCIYQYISKLLEELVMISLNITGKLNLPSALFIIKHKNR